MQPTALLGLWAIAAFFLYKAASYVVRRRRHAAKARALGCQPPPMYNVGDRLGIANVRSLYRADQEKRLPDLVIERYEEMSRREGRQVLTMANVIAGEDFFLTIDPKNIQAMLATQFKDFELGMVRNGNFEPMLGHGIFASDGKAWEHSRALLRPQFAREQVSDLDLEERHVQHLLKALPVDAATGWTDITDIQVLFFRLTMDSATEFLFGESVDSQLAALPGHRHAGGGDVPPERDERLFAQAFDKAQQHLAFAGRLGSNYWLAHTRDFKKQVREVHAFVDYFVQLALNKELREKEGLDKGSAGKRKYVFLDALADFTSDPVQLRDQLLNILLAGRDTTASLLSWLFWLLAQHPQQLATLRGAILEEFGTYDHLKGDITFSRLKNCAPLQHALNETLRLYPVVPMNQRRSATDTTLPRGGGPDGSRPVFVPRGTEVGYSVHVMHRRKDVWGDDADVFRPQRWEGRKVGWEYLPFNGGPRICIGQQFALTEAGYVVVRLLQRFEGVEGFGMEGPVSHGLTLTSCPGKGTRVRLRAAKDV